MLRKAAAFMLACALVSTSALAQSHTAPRIASTSLCGDSYLLALAPQQAAALSWQSRDALSRAPNALKALPQMWDSPEKLASTKADLILFGPGEGMSAAKFLEQTDVKTYSLTWGEDFDTVMLNISGLGVAAQQTSASQTFNQNVKSRLEDLKARAEARQEKPRILYISRSGGTAGPGTFIDAAIKAAGAINIFETPGWQTPDPEFLLSLEPDMILTSFFEQGYESVQAKGVRHNIMARYIAARPRIDIPGALWPCAGPGLIEAAELIADGLDTL
ncbi:MAG: ABC transporter substrate-binding protein [Alphaproteobacteria bacterium]